MGGEIDRFLEGNFLQEIVLAIQTSPVYGVPATGGVQVWAEEPGRFRGVG